MAAELILFHFIFSLINNLWRAIFSPATDHFIHEMTTSTDDDGKRTHIERNWLVTLVYLHKIMPFFIVNCYNFLFLFNPRQNGSNNLLLHSKASHQTATTSQVKRANLTERSSRIVISIYKINAIHLVYYRLHDWLLCSFRIWCTKGFEIFLASCSCRMRNLSVS